MRRALAAALAACGESASPPTSERPDLCPSRDTFTISVSFERELDLLLIDGEAGGGGEGCVELVAALGGQPDLRAAATAADGRAELRSSKACGSVVESASWDGALHGNVGDRNGDGAVDARDVGDAIGCLAAIDDGPEGPPRLLETAADVLANESGFFRPGSLIVLLMTAGEDDASPAPAENYVEAFLRVMEQRGENRLLVVAAVPPDVPAPRLEGALSALGENGWLMPVKEAGACAGGADLKPFSRIRSIITVFCTPSPLVDAAGAPILRPDQAVCGVDEQRFVGTEQEQRLRLPRCEFSGPTPTACPFESPEPVDNAPCWYVCDGTTAGEKPASLCDSGRWMIRWCRDRTCSPYTPAPPNTIWTVDCRTEADLAPCAPVDGGD